MDPWILELRFLGRIRAPEASSAGGGARRHLFWMG